MSHFTSFSPFRLSTVEPCEPIETEKLTEYFLCDRQTVSVDGRTKKKQEEEDAQVVGDLVLL